MTFFLEIIFSIIFIFIVWCIPALLISFLILKIYKKKISKGWCILLFLVSAFFSLIASILVGVDFSKLGVFWQFFCYASVWTVIFWLLYDKNIPSIFDTEKELKEKRNKAELQSKKDING